MENSPKTDLLTTLLADKSEQEKFLSNLENDPAYSLTAIADLLKIVNQQAAEIKEQKVLIAQNEQKQPPRRISLPLSASLRSPITPNIPLSLNSSPTPNQLTFSPLTPNFQDYGNVLEGFLNRRKSLTEDEMVIHAEKNNLRDLLKNLEQKEQAIIRLEKEKKTWTEKEIQLTKIELTKNQLETELTKQSEENQQLLTEIEESKNDIYQFDQEIKELKKNLNQTELKNQKLEKQLKRKTEEFFWLKTNHEQTKNDLTDKIEELTKLKKLTQQEKQQWQQIISEQEQKYQKEQARRELNFNKQIDNLRTFQLTADIPSKFKRSHKANLSTNSLPGSKTHTPRNSIYLKNEDNYSNPSLLFELNQKDYFDSPLSGSPLAQNENNPWEEKASELLSSIDNFTAENKVVNEQALIEENKQLQAEKSQLEQNWKILFDEKVERERTLQSFNQKELAWEAERTKYELLIKTLNQEKITQTNQQQKLFEELAETKYKLAENSKQAKEKTDKMAKKAQYYLDEKSKENRKLKKAMTEWQDTSAELADELTQFKTQEEQEEAELKQILAEAQAEADEIDALLFTGVEIEPK